MENPGKATNLISLIPARASAKAARLWPDVLEDEGQVARWVHSARPRNHEGIRVLVAVVVGDSDRVGKAPRRGGMEGDVKGRGAAIGYRAGGLRGYAEGRARGQDDGI
jgi:hypothetical protein